MMRPADFVQEICTVRLEHTFNPYLDTCGVWDRQDAPMRRRSTLQEILNRAVEVEIDAIWVGRDLGYRGGRRTGLALTDEANMSLHAERWGISIERATRGDAVTERTAAVIWDVLSPIRDHVFLWNVFPFHPHEPGNPLSNRAHTAAERRIGEAILETLIEMLRPKQVIAIGNDAHRVLERICPDNAVKVRHPSYGGQTDFLNSMREIYGLSAADQNRNGQYRLI